ncbi:MULTISPECIES: GNAT family N-acetyltransferase [unclassified Streptomyces]|uniref:GNAT family N-acetyltransferase n=1 Tax=unclassified Streptomyces TaxID=2593676 RepID=UPI002E81B921|nr:GNAT family N-acetyltransferase [Streptomyces sp. NBC_00589]WTI38400.1 GNAT family N-acetyltransferase [Streptomyces sp. NBC_00775]WUB27922.1 GNAT family N-acetyltransferase [Streptomyces sp. NBC_00589]
MESVAYDVADDVSSGWRLTHDLDVFLRRAGEFLRSRPAMHTVPLTVTDTLRRRGMDGYGKEAPVFGILEREGAVRATLFRTPPYPLNLTPLSEEDTDTLAALLADLGHSPSGVFGDRDTTAAFAGAWQRRTGATVALRERQRLYRLGTLTPPEPAPPGRARVATEPDRARLAQWYGEFAEIIGEDGSRDSGAWADDRLSYGGATLWETPDGTPVSMAGRTDLVAGQIRVAPVYTPAHLRGRGYAGAATAEVSRAALAAGADEVLLFADLANPTSNGLYQRIGYRPVADFATYDFTAHDSTAHDITATAAP